VRQSYSKPKVGRFLRHGVYTLALTISIGKGKGKGRILI